MHQVNFRRMPLLRIFTGCRCRKTFVITTSTRLRLVLRHAVPEDRLPDLRLGDVVPGAGQERLLRLGRGARHGQISPPTASAKPSGTTSAWSHSPFSCWNFTDLSTRIWPSSASTMRARSSGPRGGALEVDARPVEAAAVAGALELVLRGQPVRRAAEVRADRDQRVEAVGLAHDPDAEGVLPARVHLAHVVLAREAGLEGLRRLEEHVGEEEARGGHQAGGQAAEKATQPTGRVHFMNPRRETPLPSSSAAPFFSSEARTPGPMVFDRPIGRAAGAGPSGVTGVMGGEPTGAAGAAAGVAGVAGAAGAGVAGAVGAGAAVGAGFASAAAGAVPLGTASPSGLVSSSAIKTSPGREKRIESPEAAPFYRRRDRCQTPLRGPSRIRGANLVYAGRRARRPRPRRGRPASSGRRR